MSSVRALWRGVLTACALAPVCVAGGGDILSLKDGRVIQGPAMTRVEGGIDLTYKNGIVHVPSDLILDAVLESDKDRPLSPEESAQAEKGMVRFEQRWVSLQQRDELIAKRVEKHKKSLEEMKARGEWRNRKILDTKYFRFEYTIPDFIFEPYRDAMEAYFADFARTWRLKTPKNEDRLPVCFHASHKTFQQIGGVPPNVLGYFRFVRPWDLNIFYERLDPGLSEDVMFHEANHYLQLLVDPKFSVPHFPGESLAEYYGACSWDPVKKKLEVGLIQEGRLCEIQTDVASGEMMGLQKLITTDGMYQHYTWGWSLVHFLMKDSRYSGKFVKFFFALNEAKGVQRQTAGRGDMFTIQQEDVLVIFMRELGLKDATALRKLEGEWHDYVTGLELVTCSGKEKAGFKAQEAGRRLRAMRLFNEAIALGSKNVLVYHKLAELQAEDGKKAEAWELWKKALTFDPLNGTIYSRMAFYERHKDEAKRLQGLAAELGTEDFWVDLDLGAPEPSEPGKPGDKPGDKPQ